MLTNYGIFMNFVLIIIKICQNSFLKNFDELSNFDRFWRTLTNFDKLRNFEELGEFWGILRNFNELTNFDDLDKFWRTLTNSTNFDVSACGGGACLLSWFVLVSLIWLFNDVLFSTIVLIAVRLLSWRRCNFDLENPVQFLLISYLWLHQEDQSHWFAESCYWSILLVNFSFYRKCYKLWQRLGNWLAHWFPRRMGFLSITFPWLLLRLAFSLLIIWIFRACFSWCLLTYQYIWVLLEYQTSIWGIYVLQP